MKEKFYLKCIKDEIGCINYYDYGEKLEKKAEFIVDKFELGQEVTNVLLSKNNKRVDIILDSGNTLIFEDISMLENPMFKDLIKNNKVKLALFKFKIKKIFKNTTKFILCKKSIYKKISAVSTAAAILFASGLTIKQGIEKTKNNNSELVMEDNTYKEEPTINLSLKKNEGANTFIEQPKNTIDNNIQDTKIQTYNNMVITSEQMANTSNYYTGEVYDNLVAVMADPRKTAELNNKIQEYINENLKSKMWGNASNQGYNNYTIPEKYKNGQFTLDELFTDAANTFGVPKDILVSISQHECSQGYFVKNSYTGLYEINCGGMMGQINIYGIDSNFLPNGGYDGCDIATNPAISIYSYASAIRFFYDNFKDINIGYGFDSWDISSYMIAIGQGYVSDYDVGFKYRSDFKQRGISQLNECAPQFKALREAYLNNLLGVNDITFTVQNGVVTGWIDGDKFYYKNDDENSIHKVF